MLNCRCTISTAADSVALAGYSVHGFTRELSKGRICLVTLEGGIGGLACVAPVGDKTY